MPGDLFVSSDRRSPAGSRHSSVVVVSMAAHVVGIAAILVISIVVPGVLPTPHAADLEWDPASNMVKLADIALPPPPPPRPGPKIAPLPDSDPRDAAPVKAPTGIAPEEPRPGPEAPPLDPGTVGLTGVGSADAVPVAPSPPAQEKPTGPIRLRTGIDTPIKTHDAAPVYPVLANPLGLPCNLP